MKLNYKRTICVGFAFFLICAFWQAYDNTIPLILTNKFGMSQAWSGVIMALDNILALFLLPLFGAISDKHTGRRGRRTPFIVVGTLIAAVLLIVLSFVDSAQLRHIRDVSTIDDPQALETIYERESGSTLITPAGQKFVLGEKFTLEEFTAIRSQITQDGFQVILLAPALADDWKKGSATGLRTRGGLKVDLSWQNGRVQATATATRPGRFRFMHQGRKKELAMKKGETARLDFPPLPH